ncbi:COMM domain containing 5 Like Sm protein 4 [Rhodnius prolixus]|uniref:COMM domain containing 5 Like Sm protein 4 n=1 Tax=Rhodnius prolixus TaxID=13249 RepID=UPI003D18F345
MTQQNNINTIKDIFWRVNIVISSRDLSRVLEPVVFMELVMLDDTVQSLEVPLSKFHILRQNVALLLKEIELVKSKGSNIMRIIGP